MTVNVEMLLTLPGKNKQPKQDCQGFGIGYFEVEAFGCLDSTAAMPVPVLSVAQMRDWEKATWAAGQTEAAVIDRVGQIVAEHALRLTRARDVILILSIDPVPRGRSGRVHVRPSDI